MRSRWEVDDLRKRRNSGYILFEALVTLGLLSIGILIYHTGTLQLLAQEQDQYRRVRCARVLKEEIREYLSYGGERQRRLVYGDEVYQVFFSEDKRDAKAVNAAQEVAVHLETASFHID